MDQTDREVLGALRNQLLAQEVIDTAWSRLVAHVADGSADPETAALRRELEQTERELANLAGAIAQMGGPDTLVRQVTKREEAAQGIRRKIAALEAVTMAGVPTEEVLARVRAAFADWREMLRAHAPEVRPRRQSLIQGRITLMPKLTPPVGATSSVGEGP